MSSTPGRPLRHRVSLKEEEGVGMVRWSILLLLPGVLGVAPAVAQESVAVEVADRGALARAVTALERELSADVVRDSVGSVAAAVFVGDEVVWRGAFGWRDRDTRTLASPRTLYRAGSLAKMVTAVVLLRLVADGVVSLDEPVSRHLPEIRRLGSAAVAAAGEQANGSWGPSTSSSSITFRQLATHTAGLAREPEQSRFGRGPFRQWKRKVVAAIPWTRTVAAPGAGYAYSNIGYGMLGFALERAAGQPFEVLADSLVFRPVGMRSTSYVVLSDERARIATGYVNLPGDTADPRVPRAEHRGRGYRVPSGGLYSTVHDLARLGMVISGAVPLVPEPLLKEMLADGGQVTGLADGHPGPRRAGYGTGVQLLEIGGVRMAGHSGTVPGYAAYLMVDLDRQAGVVLLRNHNHGATNLGAAATKFLLALRDRDAQSPAD